jgi:prepilin-type N-terminal cleavage/methylation domain-containing protein
LLREEAGFTLTEIMITTVIMTVVLLALYNVFDMSLRLFSYGNNKVEAVESAREGLEKMEREIRGAYRFDTKTSPPRNHLFFTTASPGTALAVPPTTVTQLTFGNDLSVTGTAGRGVIECGTPPCEFITYKLTDDASNVPCTSANAPCALRRVNTANSLNWGDPVVENVALNGLSFQLLRSDGVTPATSEANVGIVLVRLVVSVNKGLGTPGTQTLTTVIDLRNR